MPEVEECNGARYVVRYIGHPGRVARFACNTCVPPEAQTVAELYLYWRGVLATPRQALRAARADWRVGKTRYRIGWAPPGRENVEACKART